MSLDKISRNQHALEEKNLPMKETKLVHSLDGHYDLSHVESSNVLGENLILDQHGHQITTGQELHQKVKVRIVLERCMELHEPRVILGVRQDITLGTNVGQLILFEHLRLDQRLESIDFAVSLALHELDLTEGTLSDNFDGLEVRRRLLGSQESEEVGFSL
jgi:hypothetical protein